MKATLVKKLIEKIIAIKDFASQENIAIMESKEPVSRNGFQDTPLFSGHVRHGNIVYVSGKGADAASVFEIRADTEFVLKKLENELIKAGSSMEKVLKVDVFLNDVVDFESMNEVYKGRFGNIPPVRTTVIVSKGGIPGHSLVEIDCIAYI
jgi:enamine deaminase RidA (YjgF/YER057c/UK114 family)